MLRLIYRLFLLPLCVVAVACYPLAVTYPMPPGISASFTPSDLAVSHEYAEVFCTVLEREFDLEPWESCDRYVKMDSPYPPGQLDDEIPGGWTLLRLGGFGAQCLASNVETFKDGGMHLEIHGIKQYHVRLGAFDSSEDNAIRIRDFVVGHQQFDKIIIVAHSKGAADAMVALQLYKSDLSRVKGLITIAGAIGGSWLVDDLAGLNDLLLRHLDLPKCPPTAKARRQNAIDSMKRSNRQDFLAAHERLPVPAFSISAVSTHDDTSIILRPFWHRVSPYAMEQDTHIVEREAIVPGGVFLGRALGDHWAVAMPFNPNPKVKPAALAVINKNVFPRSALLEAAVRVAVKRIGEQAHSTHAK